MDHATAAHTLKALELLEGLKADALAACRFKEAAYYSAKIAALNLRLLTPISNKK